GDDAVASAKEIPRFATTSATCKLRDCGLSGRWMGGEGGNLLLATATAASLSRNYKKRFQKSGDALGQELIARNHRDDHSAGRIDDQDTIVEFRELMALNERNVAGDA